MVKTEQTPEFFQSVVKYSSDLITIISQDGLYIYVSDSVTRLLGYTAEEMLDSSPFQHVHEHDLNMVLSHFQNIATTNQLKLPLFRYKHRNGTWRWLDCIATNMVCNKHVGGYVTNSRDVTEKVEAQRKREESKAFYEALYYNHPDLVLTLNRRGIIRNCNASLSKITGYTIEEVTNRHFTEFLNDTYSAITHEGFIKALGGNPQTFETCIFSKSKKPIYLSITLVPVVLDDRIKAIQCIAIDITETKLAGQLLKEQAKQLNNILGSITEAFFALDDSFCFTYTNKAFTNYVKYDAASLQQRNIWELFPLMQHTHFHEKCLEVSNTRLAVECEEYIEGLSTLIFWHIYPFENGIAVYFTDVTAKKKEQEVQKNLTLVASKTNNGVLITNSKGEIEWVNNSFEVLTGYNLTEVIGKDPSRFLYGPQTQPEDIEYIRRMLSLLVPFSAEFINYKKNGEQIWVALDITPILDENGELLKYINIYTDINARKQAEIRLLQLSDNLFKQNRDLQQFTYIVSHNLRAPVANVVGLTNMLQKLDTDSPQYTTALLNLNKSAVRLDTVIKDLNKILSVRKEGQKGNIQADTEAVNVAELIMEVVNSLQDGITKVNASIQLSLAPDVFLETKRAYIYSIIHNLLSNAIKYKSAKRNLLIYLESVEENDNVIIKIRDNGSGMDMAKVKPHLFKLYKRFHNHIEGKGLGLYLVKSQVEALDGQIEVESATEVGTEFKVLFKKLKYDQKSIYN